MILEKIRENVQQTAEAISSVIGVDVTVTNSKLKRIAGTGIYKDCINQQVSNDGVFAYCLDKHTPYIVRNAKEDAVCKLCSKNKNCHEFAEVVSPIIYNNKIYGIIGLIAFNETQKRLLLKNEKSILEFLNKMSNLLVNQIINKEKNNKIKLLISQLNTVINVIEKSVIITDNLGNINYYNQHANSMFKIDAIKSSNINDIFKNLNTNTVYSNKQNLKNKEFEYNFNNFKLRCIVNTKIYYDEISNDISTVIFIIEELNRLISSATNIISTNIITKFNNIKYTSKVMDNIIDLAKKASKTDSTVLITGESGTGKELFARALHYDSKRKKEPFIAINCSAIPENLFESELFGYEEGAYTGALKGGHPGKFELANNGTLLLDEIGDMPLNLQPKLLRVLQDSKVMRIGGKGYINVNVRIIASTNCNLEEKVKNKEFREDLFYRLNVIPITLPPLRERVEDIKLLVNYFINKYSQKLNKPVFDITDDALELINNYPWYGNVRELENALEYAVNMCDMSDNYIINCYNLPNKIKNYTKISVCTCSTNNKIYSLEELEKNEIKKAIKLYGISTEGIKTICDKLGISRATFYRKIKKYNIISNQILIND